MSIEKITEKILSEAQGYADNAVAEARPADGAAAPAAEEAPKEEEAATEAAA